MLVLKQEENVFPLDKQSKTLIIEQITQSPNHYRWHPGMLYRFSMELGADVDYLETFFTYDESDRRNIEQEAEAYDTIIITNYFTRGKLSNTEYLSNLMKKYPHKKIVLVTNTPYPRTIPENAKNVFITFATSPENVKATAKALFGEIQPEGEYPIRYRMF